MNKNTQELFQCWSESPFPSTKLNTYFPAYAELFSKYRKKNCTFIETGVLGGGSLFMWRNWLGPKARIIGIDLNPEANRWKDHGFEIFIGDQGDPNFWMETLPKIGQFDILLDDGGHQSFQQIVTLTEGIKHSNKNCMIVIEDTHTSFMSDFKSHGDNTFLNYAKDATDLITLKGAKMYPNRFSEPTNTEIIDLFQKIQSIQFYNSLVAFKIDPKNNLDPCVMWNKKEATPSDFRYHGNNKAITLWPNAYKKDLRIIYGA